jgi:hypothetical protein
MIRLEGSMVRVGKKTHSKKKKGQKVSTPIRLTVVECWVNTGSGTG